MNRKTMATLVLTGLAFAFTSATPALAGPHHPPRKVCKTVRDHHHVKRVCRWVR
ncbi:hypothetical protein [Novosphingobium terrae]|jgi:hypothetical protein|uniref:hypothetical protein n=1 Tax=Novosphingobium terrae TaxID=2726189 RepID=UPI001981BA62|nr:hypothetical protein [Novosphingobium terrae]